jgi:hypothetical protein
MSGPRLLINLLVLDLLITADCEPAYVTAILGHRDARVQF